MIKKLLYMVWLWKHAEEFEALQWFKTHDSSLSLYPTGGNFACLQTPDKRIKLIGLNEGLSLVQLRDKCQITWEIAEWGVKKNVADTSN